MPKLTPIQWFIAVVFLVFYGFVVFALTRDYYVRHPVRPASLPVQVNPHGGPVTGRPTGALSALDAVSPVPASVEESDPRLLGQRADGLFAQRRYQEAIPLYRRILELTPADSEAANDLGLALHYSGDSAGALDILRQMSVLAPAFQRGWLSLGFVSLQVGDQSGATAALIQARDLGPENSVGQEAIRLLGLADGG